MEKATEMKDIFPPLLYAALAHMEPDQIKSIIDDLFKSIREREQKAFMAGQQNICDKRGQQHLHIPTDFENYVNSKEYQND